MFKEYPKLSMLLIILLVVLIYLMFSTKKTCPGELDGVSDDDGNPVYCSGNGVCDNGKCKCDDPWSGDDCSVDNGPSCPPGSSPDDCCPEWSSYTDYCWGSKEDVCNVKNWSSTTVRERIQEQQIVDEDTYPDCLNKIKANADYYWVNKDTNNAYAAIRHSVNGTISAGDCPDDVDYNTNNALGQAICDMNM
jgi:hypothetical protein